MKRTNAARQAALAALVLLAAGAARAAGGHHAVDDATILPRGECEGESWLARAAGNERLLHAGLNCGAGLVELGGAADHARYGAASDTGWNLEAKWARELAEGISVGLDVQPRWQAHYRPRQAGTCFAFLATWKPREDLALHFNLGRDFVRQGPDFARAGIAAEWKPAERWTLLAERYLQQDTHFLRGGVRWAAGEHWSVDFSRAQRLSGPVPSTWTIGVTVGFGGD